MPDHHENDPWMTTFEVQAALGITTLGGVRSTARNLRERDESIDLRYDGDRPEWLPKDCGLYDRAKVAAYAATRDRPR